MLSHSLNSNSHPLQGDIGVVRAVYLYRQLSYYVELSDGSKGTVEFSELARGNPLFAEITSKGLTNSFKVKHEHIVWENGATAGAAWIKSHIAPSALMPTSRQSPVLIAPRKNKSITREELDAVKAQFACQLKRQHTLLIINTVLMATIVLAVVFPALGKQAAVVEFGVI